MRNLLIILLLLAGLTSCDAYYAVETPTVTTVITHGTPYYVHDKVVYYRYNGWYYYPYYRNNQWYYHRYHKPVPPRRREHFNNHRPFNNRRH